MNGFEKKLQPGDSVIIAGGGSLRHGTEARVDRITKTQIILGSGLRFRRDGGRQIGGSTWNSLYLIEATEERLAKIRHDKEYSDIVYKLRTTEWSKFTLDELRKVADALPPNATAKGLRNERSE